MWQLGLLEHSRCVYVLTRPESIKGRFRFPIFSITHILVLTAGGSLLLGPVHSIRAGLACRFKYHGCLRGSVRMGYSCGRSSWRKLSS
ncbi:hypothetical protein Micbo1qcDRAFT_41110 [Microdochium bolleyi]|uniref:Uncharacterized protein n=1 Tax=Microdochium bolleyi TaxID=196109 RepID=A0A136JAE2_9PEZI|nr:hypothetical protein Micbo1qcDRAFT_41110 [Microdochium bolleyi]